MKTHELMNAPEAELAPRLKEMKKKELERHAQKILTNLGQPDYDAVMSVVIRAVPKLNDDKADRFTAVQNIVRGLLPTASNDGDVDETIIARLTVIIMVIITKKFNKILAEQ